MTNDPTQGNYSKLELQGYIQDGADLFHMEDEVKLANILEALVQRLNENLCEKMLCEANEPRTGDMRPRRDRTWMRSRMPNSLSDESTAKTK